MDDQQMYSIGIENKRQISLLVSNDSAPTVIYSHVRSIAVTAFPYWRAVRRSFKSINYVTISSALLLLKERVRVTIIINLRKRSPSVSRGFIFILPFWNKALCCRFTFALSCRQSAFVRARGIFTCLSVSVCTCVMKLSEGDGDHSSTSSEFVHCEENVVSKRQS